MYELLSSDFEDHWVKETFDDIQSWQADIYFKLGLPEQAYAALKALSEKLSDVWDDLRRFLGASLDDVTKTFEELWQEIQDAILFDDPRTMPPHRYGAKLREKREGTSKHASYNYIPQAHRNLPYMRRRYS